MAEGHNRDTVLLSVLREGMSDSVMLRLKGQYASRTPDGSAPHRVVFVVPKHMAPDFKKAHNAKEDRKE